MPCQLIHDGYTVQAECYGLNFTYRPATPEEFAQLIEWQQTLSSKAAQKSIAEAIADHLVTWDATGADGEVAPLAAENVAKLPAKVFHEVRETILGYTGEQAAKNSGKA